MILSENRFPLFGIMRWLNPTPDLLHHPQQGSDKAAARDPAMSAYKSDFLNILAERGFIHQVSEPEVLDARAKAGAITA